MNNKKLVLVLTLVLVGLGGLATWDEWQTKKDVEVEKGRNKVATFKLEDLTGIDYVSNGLDADKPQVVLATLAKQGDAWRVTKPVDAAADVNVIKNLVSTVTDYAYSQVVAETKDKWAEYGLTQPTRTITFQIGGEKPSTFTLYVGAKAPVGYSVYFRTSQDDKVYAGSQHLLMSTGKSLGDFRDKIFVKADEATAKTLTYAQKGQAPFELGKTEGKWKIVKPETLEADDAEMREFFGGISQLRAESFVDQPSPTDQAAFQTPDYEISWTSDAGLTTTLKIVEKSQQQLDATLDPTQRIFVLGEDARSKVKKELLSFRNRRVLAIDSMQLTKVEIDGEPYENLNGMWYKPGDLESGKAKEGVSEQAHVRAFVVDLEFARADEFLVPTDAKVQALAPAPDHRIKLSFKEPEKNPDVTVDAYAAPGEPDKLFIKRSGLDQVFRVNKSVLNSVKPGAAVAPAEAPEGPGALQDLPLEDSPDPELPGVQDLSRFETEDNKG